MLLLAISSFPEGTENHIHSIIGIVWTVDKIVFCCSSCRNILNFPCFIADKCKLNIVAERSISKKLWWGAQCDFEGSKEAFGVQSG